MRLLELRLENFRQFYGKQALPLETRDPGKNVTIVWGGNGAGKTTLLNAFTWALYGDSGLTPDLEQHDWLINNRAYAEASAGSEVVARVEVDFDHDDRRYTISRVATTTRLAGGARGAVVPKSSLGFIDQSGEFKNRENPLDVILQILPARLRQFFFFNGERIEQILRPTANGEIREAVKTLLGLEVVERGIKHVNDALARLRREYKDVGNTEVARLVELQNRLTEERTTLESQLQETTERLAASLTEREDVLESLRNHEDTRVLQAKRDSLEKEIESKTAETVTVRRSAESTINEKGFLAFVGELIDQTTTMIEGHRTRGELPTPLKRQFVQDLLDAATCICGTPLVQGESAHDHVSQWLLRAGLADAEDALIRLGAYATDARLERRELYSELQRAAVIQRRLRDELTSLEEQFSEISRKVSDLPVEEAGRLEDRRVQLDSDIVREQRLQARLEAEIDQKVAALKLAEKQLAEIQEAQEAARVAKKRLETAQGARDTLMQLYELRTQDVRMELDASIKSVYRNIAFKDYTPVLDEEFQLSLVNQDGENVARSSGEAQTLSLSFVGALAALAREQAQGDRGAEFGALMGFEGGLFPVVIDSAFGTLDENYRAEVARALPTLTNQVVLFVSKAQGKGVVEDELRPRVAREFVVVYHTPKPDEPRETIDLGGYKFDYIVPSDDGTEWASIEEVAR